MSQTVFGKIDIEDLKLYILDPVVIFICYYSFANENFTIKI